MPNNEVRAAFGILAGSFPDEDKFNEILTYFSTCIEGATGRDPKIPITVWNHQLKLLLKDLPKEPTSAKDFTMH